MDLVILFADKHFLDDSGDTGPDTELLSGRLNLSIKHKWRGIELGRQCGWILSGGLPNGIDDKQSQNDYRNHRCPDDDSLLHDFTSVFTSGLRVSAATLPSTSWSNRSA